MDQTNRPIVGDFLGPLFLGEKDNVGRVDPLEVGKMEVVEVFNEF
jgi:hypothetical protein